MEQQTIEQKIAQLKKIKREDGDVEYSQAQVELGLIYKNKKNEIEEAESYFKKVVKEDDPKSYAIAQFYLGYIYEDEKNIEQAKLHYSQVERLNDSLELYAKAQLSLGLIYNEEENIEQAKLHYSQVERLDDFLELYARAQFSLAVIYKNEKNIEQSKLHYSQVERLDNDPELYVNAQFILAVIYKNEKNIEQVKLHYSQVERLDNDPELYAMAQLSLGLIYNEEENIEQAKFYYSLVKRQDNPQLYALAQFFWGSIYHEENIEQAKLYYSHIKQEDNPVLYIDLQSFLGNYYFYKKTMIDLKSAAEYYKKVSYLDSRFSKYVTAQIRLMAINLGLKFTVEDDSFIIDPICKIRELTEKIQKQLLVTFKLNELVNDQERQFERQVAHYTRAGVLFSLLKNEPSDFRLNVIDFMNDPTENQVLTSWLGIQTEPNNDIKSFLASFSFNHNSLNQFRLYGNENNIVGSSVSMVFNQQFFCDNAERSINAEAINLLSEKKASQKANNDFIANSYAADSKDSIDINDTSSIYPLPLFRCLYFDPNSEYISIAKRSKFSFYLEHQGCLSTDIEKKWANYIDLLKEQNKIDTIRNLLNEIKKEIRKLKASKKLKVFTNLEQLITLALMPISCLIKHAAFEDEDECRIIYITHIADEKIQAPTDYALANSLFVNYNKVEDFLKKIYLGPQCPPYHKLWISNHFRTSKSKTRSKAIKVVQSEMPLR